MKRDIIGSCANEPINCVRNSVEHFISFQYAATTKGKTSIVEGDNCKHILFCRHGQILVKCDEITIIVKAREMAFFPIASNATIEILEDSELMLLNYNAPMPFCSTTSKSKMFEQCKDIKFEFKPLHIKDELHYYLVYLKYYLLGGKRCCQMQELKFKELGVILSLYYTQSELANFFYPVVAYMSGVRDRVLENYASVKTVSELASICGYSESRFNEVFVNEFGQSPYQWMMKQKSKVVLERLHKLEVPIKDIVYDLNFSDPSHFTRYCKNQYGLTPSEIRRQIKQAKD